MTGSSQTSGYGPPLEYGLDGIGKWPQNIDFPLRTGILIQLRWLGGRATDLKHLPDLGLTLNI